MKRTTTIMTILMLLIVTACSNPPVIGGNYPAIVTKIETKENELTKYTLTITRPSKIINKNIRRSSTIYLEQGMFDIGDTVKIMPLSFGVRCQDGYIELSDKCIELQKEHIETLKQLKECEEQHNN